MRIQPQQLLNNLSSPWWKKQFVDGSTTVESNNWKLASVLYDGYYAEWEVALPIARLQRFLKTSQGGFLDRFGLFWLLQRRANETDEPYRIRIAQLILKKWGVFSMDELLVLTAVLLDTDPSNITFTENLLTGAYEPAYIEFYVDPSVFTSLGITDVPTAIADLTADLEELAPAGVRLSVISSGSGEYDSGDDYDAGETYS